MELMTRSSRARVVGRESSESRCAYVRVEGEVESESKVSWRSFCSCIFESFGRFGVSGMGELACEHRTRVTSERTSVFRQCSPGEDLQEGEVRCIFV